MQSRDDDARGKDFGEDAGVLGKMLGFWEDAGVLGCRAGMPTLGARILGKMLGFWGRCWDFGKMLGFWDAGQGC